MPPEKHPTGLAKAGQDSLVILDLVLEAAVGFLWPAVATVMHWLARVSQIPGRWFNGRKLS